MSNIRPIAIYLPQFHPIPENDLWWGKGFTEWRNVTKARPLYPGHYQPHYPADLGFYDLRLREARMAQAELAKQYGIYGFCYYHYWFNGKQVLERPVNEILETQEPEFPFMLCWANENWTRTWDGEEKDVLLSQNYSEEDDENHLEYLIKFFNDPRYIRIDNKPVVVIYKTFLLPDPKKTTDIWRKVAAKHGIELYLCHMVFSYAGSGKLEEGFDGAIDFEPFGIRRKQNVFLEMEQRYHEAQMNQPVYKKLLNRLPVKSSAQNNATTYSVIEYEYCYENLKALKEIGFKLFPSVSPGWDNTARKNLNPNLILHDSTPQKFEEWFHKVANEFEPDNREENFIFINAWNEWAEGNHLEPCLKWGHSYLQAIKNVQDKNETFRTIAAQL